MNTLIWNKFRIKRRVKMISRWGVVMLNLILMLKMESVIKTWKKNLKSYKVLYNYKHNNMLIKLISWNIVVQPKAIEIIQIEGIKIVVKNSTKLIQCFYKIKIYWQRRYGIGFDFISINYILKKKYYDWCFIYLIIGS